MSKPSPSTDADLDARAAPGSDDASPPRIGRRGALARVLGLLLGGGLFVRYLSPRRPRRQAVLRVPVADVPHDGALVFPEERVAVVDRGDERYALSLVCTHLGCTAAVGADAIRCHCHGSVFDLDGAVLRGPAADPLERLALRDAGDHLEVLR